MCDIVLYENLATESAVMVLQVSSFAPNGLRIIDIQGAISHKTRSGFTD